MTTPATPRMFGTDGIRGIANVAPLDPATLVRIGAVLGRLIKPTAIEKANPVLLGNDGRESAGMISAALTAGLTSEGVDVADAGLLTTPALAHETRLGKFSAGIMISASHNPARDNGIKIFSASGAKVADELEQRIEARLARSDGQEDARTPGRTHAHAARTPQYRAFLSDAFRQLDLSSTHILVDCANGGGSEIVPDMLRSLGADVDAVHAVPNGTNINANCGALHPSALAGQLMAGGYQLGICLDGDGDRSIFVDEHGSVVHGDALLAALALALDAAGRLAERSLAVTVMTNLGLKKAVGARGIRVVETPVGDRSVMAAMRQEGLTLGGENSGHVIFGEEHHYTGDGLYTALKLLEIMIAQDRSLSEVAACFQAFPQKLVNVPVQDKPPIASLPEVVEAERAITEELGDDGRVVLRYSGTENLCRVMVEARTEEIVDTMVARLTSAVESALGAATS